MLKKLAKKHGLSDQKRENRCMTVNDLKQQVETTLGTTEKSFSLGELRILCVLFLQLLAPTGARPTSVLKLRYRDIRVVLSRDLDSSPHKVLIRFTLEFTKTYLGTKDAYMPRPSWGCPGWLVLIVSICTDAMLGRP